MQETNYLQNHQVCFCQIVQADEFLNFLNESSSPQNAYFNPNNAFDDDYDSISQYLRTSFPEQSASQFEQQWMFGTNTQMEMKLEENEPPNPQYEAKLAPGREQRSDSFIGVQLLQCFIAIDEKPKINKSAIQKEIIQNNKDLFQTNQSKSIYLSKISQLVEQQISPNSSFQSIQSSNSSKIQEKFKPARADSDSSSQEGGQNQSIGPEYLLFLKEDSQQQKLAKNRESARNSRKRKKVYVELLETKVQELNEELSKLQITCKNQQQYIEYCNSQNQQLFEFLQGQTLCMDELARNVFADENVVQKILNNLHKNQFGSRSKIREEIVQYQLSNFFKYLIPLHIRFISETAEKGMDIFQSSYGTACSFSWTQEMNNHLSRLRVEQLNYLQTVKKSVIKEFKVFEQYIDIELLAGTIRSARGCSRR